MAAMLAELPNGEALGILITALFLRRIPAEIKRPLCAKNFGSPRVLAEYVDRLWDGRHAKTVAVAEVSPILLNCFTSRSRSRNGHVQWCRSPSAQDHLHRTQDTCFYHEKFGLAARKGPPPCSFLLENIKAGDRF